jgi:superfamily II DNA or RNA helicase
MKFVDVPGEIEHEVLAAPSDIVDAPLPTGVRVWVRGTLYGWTPGVIRSGTSAHRHHVDLVGVGRNLVLAQDQFIIRWAQPLANPALAVAHGLTESPGYYEARSDLLEELVRQRRACRGIAAVLSAPIAHFQHQVDTAARVLADPVMRYLLADEVGLGKTIEAGLVARQLLIEDPTARVLVLCPENLVGQWQSELRDRLGLGAALATGMLVVRDHAAVRSESRLDQFALIIIDEAHNILPHITPGSNADWDLRSADGLLALSATPMRGDLSTFRRLLALVDPVAFDGVSQDAFLARLDEREQSAGDIQVLSARRASLRQKTFALESVVAAFPEDANVAEMAAECLSSDDAKDESWTILADYLREIHRLSRRMIRHRRDGEFTQAYTVAGRFATFIDLDDPGRIVADAFLDSYRRALTSPSADAAFAQAVERALASPRTLRDELANLLNANANAQDTGASSGHRPLFEMTIARLEMAGLDARLEAAIAVVKDRIGRGLKVVVASAFTQTAERFERMLTESTSRYSVFSHFASSTSAEKDASVARFLSRYGGSVLVADASMEEGRNLQQAHVLVNLDLPLDANRLDQRIGRLDRYVERPSPAEVVVFRESASDWGTAHLALLDEGIGVLDDSVSTVQRLLAATLSRIVGSLINDGADAFRMNAQGLRYSLEQERDSIDLLEEMESVTSAALFSDEAFAELLDYDSDVQNLRQALGRLTRGIGSLGLQWTESKDGIVTFAASTNTGLPADEEASVRRLLQPKAFERAPAIHTPDVLPFRIGDPLVDWLQRYLIADERGRASAIVRPVADIVAPMLWLHSEILIEFDSNQDTLGGHAARRRLGRRGEGHFPPLRIEIWTDPAGPAPELLVRDALEIPHSNVRDEVLRGRVWDPVLKAFPGWAHLCLESADAAREAVTASPQFVEAVEGALSAADADTKRRLAILEARSRRLPTPRERVSAAEELELERIAGEALRNGISHPLVRIVASGVCVLWPEEDF